MLNHLTLRSATIMTVLACALALLSLTAGVPKVIQLPQELEFLGALGLSSGAVSLVGIVQVVGGGLLPWKKTRLTGAVLVAVTLLVSSLAIFASGDPVFGSVSLVPFVLSIILLHQTWKKAPTSRRLERL